MKTSSNRRTFTGALLATLGLVSTTSAVQVTYHVDMSVQIALGDFIPGTDTVFISGELSTPDWQSGANTVATNYILTPNGVNPSIYEGTFIPDQAPGVWEDYQFVINPNNAFNAPDLRWESNVGNRFFPIPTTDTNLPVVFWNNVTNASGVVTNPVTFQVDMSVQTALGNFDPNTDLMLIAGDWDWNVNNSPLLVNNGSNVWSTTLNVSGLSGSTINYKFVASTFAVPEDWEDNGVGPNGAQNRQFVLATTPQVLPVVFFNNLTNLPPPVPVTFQVNMAAQMALGNFVDGGNQVTAAGTFNDWDAVGFVLTNTPGNPTIYTGTTNIIGGAGSLVSYQYVIDGASWEEDVGNRTFNLATNAQTVALVYWDDVGDLGELVVTPAGGGQILNASWTPGPLVRLQVSTGLPNWADVAGSTGQSNSTVNVTSDETYLRLIGP